MEDPQVPYSKQYTEIERYIIELSTLLLPDSHARWTIEALADQGDYGYAIATLLGEIAGMRRPR